MTHFEIPQWLRGPVKQGIYPATCRIKISKCLTIQVRGWGTTLQAEMSRVYFPIISLDFSIYSILPEGLWPLGSTQSLPGIFLWLMDFRHVRLTASCRLWIDCVEKCENLGVSQPYGPPLPVARIISFFNVWFYAYPLSGCSRWPLDMECGCGCFK
jgi:hypothetical protein